MKIYSLITGFVAILCLAVSLYTADEMSDLRFWGHLPLFFAMSSWAAIVLIIKSLQRPNAFSLYCLSLAILTGLLLAKAFVYTSPLLFIGWVPLLLLQDRLESENPKVKWYVHAWYAYIAFMFWNIGATYWVANAALIPAIVAFALNSLFMTIPWIGMICFGRSYPNLKYLGLVCFWICFEWVHHSWEISWPWLSLGNGLAYYPEWIQWYDITGTFGGSLWILIVNILLFLIIRDRKFSIKQLSIPALVLILPIAFSYYKFYDVIPEGTFHEVCIVQPNYEPHYEKFAVDQRVQMDHFEKLSKSVISPNTHYLIWPETSFEAIQTNEFDQDWRIQRMQQLLQEYPDLCLVSGLTTIKVFKAGEKLTDAARSNHSGNHSVHYEIQNSCIQICNDTDTIPIYVKSKLVPGVETFPYRRLLPFLKPIVDKLQGSVYGLGKQQERSVFERGYTKIAPVICYESIYGNYVGDYIRNGAQSIFIMTNDGWWDDTPGYKQHLAFGSLRAIEFRRSIARSANTGVSCFINHKGLIENPTVYGKSDAIKKGILFSNQVTIYLILGDLIAYVCIYFTLAFIIMNLSKFLKVRFSKNL
jgi:apolipoprotein N-acyltransferase